MGLPLDFAADLMKLLSKHGVKYLGHEEMNGAIAALSPCFEPGYQERVTKKPVK